MGYLCFLFPARRGWSQVMHIFVAGRWQGEPAESSELRPVWLDVRRLPFERMWPDARYWLPRVLAGEPVRMRFVYAADNETLAAGPEEGEPGPPGCGEAPLS
jgi:8-oxo-dGTP diphosphatase